MQTFLPYSDFARSAQCLDRQRLGKQRVEVLQILGVLCGQKKGWANHPAVKMWRGYEGALLAYGLAICNEWHDERGYNDTCRVKMIWMVHEWVGKGRIRVVMPPWMGDKAFHTAHKSNLYRKDPEHYSQFAKHGPDLGYIWPVA